MRTARTLSWLILLTVALTACPTTPTQPPTPAQDFGFTLETTVFAAVPGTSITTSVTIIPINGFTGTVALAITNQDGTPADPGITLDPTTITVSTNAIAQQSIQQQILIEVALAVVNDSFDLRITATSGNLSSTADLTLTVADNLQPQVAITSPADGSVFTGSRKVTLSGTLSSLNPIIAVDILGGADLVSINFDQSSLSATVELENNANSVSVIANNDQGLVGVSEAIELTFPFLELANFQNASVVIGQPDFVSITANQGGLPGANTLSFPFGNPFVTNTGTLFLPDRSNSRVLGFDQILQSNDASADFVLGQPDFTTVTFGTSATTLFLPTSVHSDGTKLAVVDFSNNRVLIWNTIPSTTQAPADVVVGQPDFVTSTPACDESSLFGPESVIIAGGKLIVADFDNNRVLIWNTVPTTNGEPADVVLGQSTFTNCIANDDDQDGAAAVVPTARTFFFPTGVWSDGTRLVVADTGNDRVLIWNSIPSSNFTAADLVIGQPGFVTNTAGTDAQTFDQPRHVFSNGNQLFIVELTNDRGLVFNSFPSVNAQAADRVLGQSTFTNNTANDDDQDGVQDGNPTARTFLFPLGVFAFEDRLIVTDNSNHRFLIFESQ